MSQCSIVFKILEGLVAKHAGQLEWGVSLACALSSRWDGSSKLNWQRYIASGGAGSEFLKRALIGTDKIVVIC